MMDQYKGIPSPPRYIYHRDRLVSLKPHKILYDPIFKGAFAGLVTALFRRFKARNEPYPSEDMSISEFVKFATGRPELTDNLVSAMLHGIWGGDADKLSMASAMPAQYWRFFSKHMEDCLKVAEYELGALISLGNDRKLRKFRKDTQKDQLVFFKDGMSSLPNALERGLRERKNVTFELGNPIVNLRYDSKKGRALVGASLLLFPFPFFFSYTKNFFFFFPIWRQYRCKLLTHLQAMPRNSGEHLPFDKVVCTTTSKVLYQMTCGAIPSLADSPNVSIMAVNLWYPNPFLKNEQGVGYLVPRSAKNNPEHLLGVFFDSDVVPLARGEDVGTKLFVLMGGHHYDKLAKPPTQEEGIEMAKAAVERHLGIPRDEPCFAVAQYAKDCIPQHHVGHWKKMGMAESEIDYAFQGSLAVAGGSYTSIGVMGGLHAGFEVAQHIALSAREHVGDTGLGQFQSSIPALPYYNREELVLAGRDIAPQEGWFHKVFS